MKINFKLLERLNSLRNSLDIFSELSYEERLNHKHYTRLLNEADKIALEINNLNN